MALFTTTLDLYGGVLWSGELQGFIIQQMMPTMALHCIGHGKQSQAPSLARPRTEEPGAR